MKKAALAVAAALALVIVGGGGYLWVQRQGEARLQAVAEQIRAGLGPNGSFFYTASVVHPLSDSVELSEVALRAPSGELITAAHVTLMGRGEHASLHATPLRVSGLPGAVALNAASLDAKDLIVPLPPAGQPLKLDPATVAFTDLILHAVGITGGAVSATLASVEVKNYGAGRSSSFAAADAAIAATTRPSNRTGFATLDGGGIDLASVVDALERKARPPQPTAPTALELDGFYVANGDARPLTVRTMAIADTPAANGDSSTKLDLNGITFVPADAQTRVKLERIGLRQLGGNLSLAASYATAGGVLAMSPVIAEVDSIGTLTIGFRLGHLDQSKFAGATPNLATLLAAVADTQLDSVDAQFTDAGLLDRLLAMGSRQTGTPVPALRAQIVARIRQDRSLADIPQGDQIRDALGSFAADGGRLDLGLRPSPAITIVELTHAGQINPVTLVTRLGLSLRHSDVHKDPTVIKQ